MVHVLGGVRRPVVVRGDLEARDRADRRGRVAGAQRDQAVSKLDDTLHESRKIK